LFIGETTDKASAFEQAVSSSALNNGIGEGCGHLVAPAFAHVNGFAGVRLKKRFYWVTGLLGTFASGRINDKKALGDSRAPCRKKSY